MDRKAKQKLARKLMLLRKLEALQKRARRQNMYYSVSISELSGSTKFENPSK